MNEHMTMTFETITPEKAEELLLSNTNNRSISKRAVESYARDMKNGNWHEDVGSAISISESGIIRDGQHRLHAILLSKVPVKMWICRGVSDNGIYDSNRTRSISDNLRINTSFDSLYKSRSFVGFAKVMICKGVTSDVSVSFDEVKRFIEINKEDLDEFFSATRYPKRFRNVSVNVAMYLAYDNGYCCLEDLKKFYEVLNDGMSTCEEEYPIIALRNYILADKPHGYDPNLMKRTQYAIKQYIEGTCSKKTFMPKEVIWDFRDMMEGMSAGRHLNGNKDGLN